MDVYLVFNDLCISQEKILASGFDEYHAQSWMQQFGDVITEARRDGIKVLRVRSGFFDKPLVPNYTIRNWATDRRIDRELKRRIQSAATSYDDLDFEKPAEIEVTEIKRLAFEFSYNSGDAADLGFAFLLDSISVSLDTDECWKQPEITVDVTEMVETENDIEFVSSNVVVRHLSHSNHLRLHRGWLQLDRYATGVQNGSYLLSKLDDWFPNIVILERAKQQIEEMQAGTPQLRQFISKLFELENYCRIWESGGFDKDLLASKVSPESLSVRNDGRLRSLREFALPTGDLAFFEWHMRLTPDEWRLYFLPNSEARKIYVGYVGRHLPTQKY